jgi:prevent-host-death family protein
VIQRPEDELLYSDVHDCTLVVVSDTVTVSEARATMPEILERVQAGDEITLTRHGQPVAVIVRPDALRARRRTAAMQTARDIRAMLEEGRRTPLHAGAGIAQEWAEGLISEIGEGRSRR